MNKGMNKVAFDIAINNRIGSNDERYFEQIQSSHLLLRLIEGTVSIFKVLSLVVNK